MAIGYWNFWGGSLTWKNNAPNARRWNKEEVGR